VRLGELEKNPRVEDGDLGVVGRRLRRILAGPAERVAQQLLGRRKVQPRHELAGTFKTLRHAAHRARLGSIWEAVA
jgi:hypothetical protein